MKFGQHTKTLKNLWFFDDFGGSWPSRWPYLAPKWHPKSNKNRSKRASKPRCKLCWDLEPSWSDFWSILAPSWAQVGPKLAPKSGKLGSQDDVKKRTKKVERRATREKWAEGGGSLLVPFGSCFPSFPVPRGAVSLVPRGPVSPIQKQLTSWHLSTVHFVPQGHGGGYIYMRMCMYIYIYTYRDMAQVACGMIYGSRCVFKCSFMDDGKNQ